MSVEEILTALDKRIREAIEAKATGETIAYLCEARAWLVDPTQTHGAHRPIL